MKVGILATTAFAFLIGFPVASMAGLAPDNDSDGVPDVLDNCLTIPNAGSPSSGGDCDTDQDGYGNMCDCDFNQDGVCEGADYADQFIPDFTGSGFDSGNGTDMNCEGLGATGPPNAVVDGGDFAIFVGFFTGTGVNGPSGLSCANPLADGSCPN